ncbi:MAG: 4-hydroxy-3-methylbut-2-enyl diphosphate reductase [Acidobacteria bacterium]|nr:4-hydroxy-3-methylbut-2-enyl diphosphate reductase [Acidobacteriota bacterium]
MLRLRLARSAGFCFGVRRAIDIAIKAAGGEAPVYMLGNIVHNEYVVDQIRQTGIRVVEDLDAIPPGSTLLMRAHGTTPEIYRKAAERGLRIVDATCPMVLEIHRIVRKLEEEGYEVVIIGDQNHDEVRGIAAQVSRPLVVSGPADVPGEGWRSNRLGVVVQSTQNLENVQAIISRLVPACRELRFIDTICKPTTDHQNEIRRMPLENDAVVVVGSFTSANTRRLAELSVAANPRTHHVQTASELEAAWFEGIGSVGVTAGASTPDVLIRDVLDRIRDFRPDTVVDPDERVSPEGAEAEPTATGGRP